MSVRVTFSCVAENRPDWHLKTKNLALSVRELGGTLNDAPVVVNYVDGVDATARAELEAMGVDVRVVERVDPHYPYANKLRMLEMADDFDVLVALDCDVVVVGDVSELTDPGSLRAKPVDDDPLTDEEWSHVFGALGLAEPARGLKATSTGKAIFPYFNSGAVFVPRTICGPLREKWMEANTTLLAMLVDDPGPMRPSSRMFVDQLGLAGAALQMGIDIDPLPASCNYPVHLPVVEGSIADAGPPLIVHYHKSLDKQGFLLGSEVDSDLDRTLDDFNRLRARHTGQTYAGLERVPAWLKQVRRARRLVADQIRARPALTKLKDKLVR
jgi:hypothetical protein